MRSVVAPLPQSLPSAPARGSVPLLTQLRPPEHPSFLRARLPRSSDASARVFSARVPFLPHPSHRDVAPLCSPPTPRWVRPPFPPPAAERVATLPSWVLLSLGPKAPRLHPAATLTCPRHGPPGAPGSACGAEPHHLLTGPDLEIVFRETPASLSSPGGPRSQISVFL